MKRTLIILVSLTLTFSASGHGLRGVAVPFVGCPSEGMADQDAPTGKTKWFRLSPSLAARLTYYETADGLGRLGPRGWHCQGQNGNASIEMYLTPTTPPSKEYPFDDVRLTGAAIEFSRMDGEGSSATAEHAALAGRYFSRWRSLARKHDEGVRKDVPATPPLELKPFPSDRTLRRGASMVMTETPPRVEGLGTYDKLGPGRLPIVSKLVVTSYYAGGDEFAAIRLTSARLPPAMRDLLPVILNQSGR